MCSISPGPEVSSLHIYSQSQRFLDPRPKLLASTYQVYTLTPVYQIKRHGEGQRKIYYMTLDCRGKRHFKPSSAIFRIQT
jgi:hypothetical protein